MLNYRDYPQSVRTMWIVIQILDAAIRRAEKADVHWTKVELIKFKSNYNYDYWRQPG